ncbi:hypothetical protein H0E87_012512 [Populus deltoides]|uniref:Uncharacterized protein n=1 Tax=Populus deltoides TaxID=3696 RepID=A0A8T2YJV3_POPDE|nr:hypothetical protein H0E87_012512 [Populus deltoides]
MLSRISKSLYRSLWLHILTPLPVELIPWLPPSELRGSSPLHAHKFQYPLAFNLPVMQFNSAIESAKHVHYRLLPDSEPSLPLENDLKNERRKEKQRKEAS